MIIINKTILLGRLTKDPDLRLSQNGNSVARFTLAVNRQFKKDEADFINCIAFNKQAEVISQYLTKGSQIALAGSIRTGSYDAQDGTKRYTTDVIVENFEFVGGGNANNTGNNPNSGNDMDDDNFDNEMTPVNNGDVPF